MGTVFNIYQYTKSDKVLTSIHVTGVLRAKEAPTIVLMCTVYLC
jgi:hypothetical protein